MGISALLLSFVAIYAMESSVELMESRMNRCGELAYQSGWKDVFKSVLHILLMVSFHVFSLLFWVQTCWSSNMSADDPNGAIFFMVMIGLITVTFLLFTGQFSQKYLLFSLCDSVCAAMYLCTIISGRTDLLLGTSTSFIIMAVAWILFSSLTMAVYLLPAEKRKVPF